MSAPREILTARQIAARTGVGERMIRYAMRVQVRGVPALGLAVEADTLPMVQAATIAGLPAEQQTQALAAALRGEKPPKRPTAAERAAADAEVWRTRCGLLALEIERLTGEDACAAMDRAIADYPGRGGE